MQYHHVLRSQQSGEYNLIITNWKGNQDYKSKTKAVWTQSSKKHLQSFHLTPHSLLCPCAVKSFSPFPHHLFHSTHISHPTQLSPKSLLNSPSSLPFPSISLSRHLSTPDKSHGSLPPLPPLLHLFSLIPVPEASRYRGQCNPAIGNLQFNPFNLSRLNTKRCPNKSWKNYGPLRNRLRGCFGRRVEG